VIVSFSAQAATVDKFAEKATHKLIGKVKKVESYYGSNTWGDNLIFSRVSVKVEKKLKGEMFDNVEFTVEGGTVGDMTLNVSECPLFSEGEVFLFYLKKTDGKFEYLYSQEPGETIDAVRPGKSSPAKIPLLCCNTFAKWPNANVYYYINPNTSDVSPDCAINDIISGAAAWNDCSGINLSYSGKTPTHVISSTDGNVIFFRPDSSGNTIAVTYTWYARKGGQIIAFDMVFYDGAWKFFSETCPTNCSIGFYIQTIATHELGHAIGLDHNKCGSSMMYPYASYCTINGLSADDVACARNLYGY